MLRVALVLDDYNELIYLQTILRKIGIDVEGLQNVKKYEELSLGFNPQVLITSAFGRKVSGLEFIKSLHRVRGLPKVIVLSNQERHPTQEEKDQSGADHFLTSPVNPKNLIIALAQMTHVDEKVLIEKFEKLQATGLGLDEPIQLIGQDGDASVMGSTPRFSFREQESIDGAIPSATSSGTSFKLKKDVGSMGSMPLEISPAEEAGAAPYAPGSEPVTERTQHYAEYLAKLDPLGDPRSTSYKRDKIFQMNKKIRSAPAPIDIQEIESDRQEFVKQLFKKD